MLSCGGSRLLAPSRDQGLTFGGRTQLLSVNGLWISRVVCLTTHFIYYFLKSNALSTLKSKVPRKEACSSVS